MSPPSSTTPSYYPITPALPQELIDHILDHLHADHPTLHACALVSPSWLPTTRRHLFSKIALKATSPQNGVAIPQERCQRLYKLLLKKPEIIPNIRELEICEGSPLHHYNSADAYVQGSTTWVTTERSLTSLFRMLTHVQRLDFAATSTLYWTLLPPTFQKALCGLLSLESLCYVRLHSWMFPNFGAVKRMLGGCRNLRGFALSSTNVGNIVESVEAEVEARGLLHAGAVGGPERASSEADQDNDNGGDGVARSASSSTSSSLSSSISSLSSSPSHTTQTPPQPIPLEVLTLDFVTFSHLETWFLCKDPSFPVDIRNLRELRVAHFHDVHVVEKLLKVIGGSLESFHLKPGTWEVHPFDLSQNTGLRAIRLTLDDPRTAMDWATTILSSLAASCSSHRSSPYPSHLTHPTSSSSLHPSSHHSLHLATTPLSSAITSIGLEFYTDPKKLSGWSRLADLFLLSPLSGTLRRVEIGLFAIPGGVDFGVVREEMRELGVGGGGANRVVENGEVSGLREVGKDDGVNGPPGGRGIDVDGNHSGGNELSVRWYQLGVKSSKSRRELTPRICRYES